MAVGAMAAGMAGMAAVAVAPQLEGRAAARAAAARAVARAAAAGGGARRLRTDVVLARLSGTERIGMRG